MKLLVDENIPPLVTEFLREEGHEVKAIRDFAMGADDENVVKVAVEEDRVLHGVFIFLLLEKEWIVTMIGGIYLFLILLDKYMHLTTNHLK